MRRPFANAVAVVAVLTQVVLGAATPLGLVLCVGESHASLELASDDCCAPHHDAADALERSCCADVPLHAEASLNDAQRGSQQMPGPAIVVAAVADVRTASPARAAEDVAAALAAQGFARRSVALRL